MLVYVDPGLGFPLQTDIRYLISESDTIRTQRPRVRLLSC